MQTKLGRICDALIEAGWLAALIVTPLFFNTFSNRVFEPDKLHLLRSIALVMSAVWILQLVDAGTGWRKEDGGLWAHIRRTPLVLPALVLILAYIVSTVLSIAPRISFFGSYVRMQGTLTFLSYVAIGAMVLTHLRTRGQVNRLIYTVVLSSLPISIYAIIQHAGLDALPWGGDVRERVAANMGNAIFVAAYLILAVFLTLERLIDSVAALLNEETGSTADALRAGAYLFILAVQLVAIVFTQSRGPWLGLFAGLYVFGVMGILMLGRWAGKHPRAPRWIANAVRPVWLGLIGLTVAGLAFLVVLNLPQSPLEKLREVRYVGRLGSLFSITEGTNAVRVLIWEGVVDMMLKPHPPIAQPDGTPDTWNIIRPLIGYGPESMWVAYNRFYPPNLAHYEARNASPDRSHNETFDALVRTGLFGLLAQLFLYASVFYYALRWLGLMRGKSRRNLFVGLLVGGAMVGIIVPLIVDRSFRLAGLGLPVGFIVGMIVYLTIDLLLSSPNREAAGQEGEAHAGGARQQLLILALFSAIVAHFIEVHFGIAIASTLTHFWILAPLLVVVGMGWVDRVAAPKAIPAAGQAEVAGRKPEAAGPRSAEGAVALTAPSPTARQKARAKSQSPAARSGAPAATRRPAERPPAVAPRPPAAPPIRPGTRSPYLTFLPYAGIGALITLVLTWDYGINQTGAQGAFNILWNAFTARVDNTVFRVVQSPMLLMLMVFTWLVGGLLAVTEHAHFIPIRRGVMWATNALMYIGTVVGVWLVYGLFHASRLSVQGFSGLAVFHHVASHILVFDIVLFALMLLLAVGLWAGDTRPRLPRFSQEMPALPLLAGAGAALVAVLVIVNVNVKTVQADTYYKQGLAYESAGVWDGAAVLHGEAAKLEPAEDFYYLFLGRALLQLAAGQPAGNAALPTDTAKLSETELLGVIERGLRARNREDMMRASYAALSGAQRLNPYNTDHSANLARHNRSWAFTNALGPNDAPTNALLRQLATTRAPGVDQNRLNQSLTYYRQATSLSPQNAQLWNELATTQFIMGDTEAALATLSHSETVDPIFYQTFTIRGDILATLGDKAGALAAYRKSVALAGDDHGLLSAVGVYSAQTGDNDGALAAFKRLAELQQASLTATEQQLSDHNALVSRLGGYGGLLATASQRRDALQGSIPTIRSQLHLTYRNLALVLRDSGRISDALQTARTALSYAADAERPTIEALISELQRKPGG